MEHQGVYGKIEYTYPRVGENIKFLSKCGVKLSDISNPQWLNDNGLEVLGNMVLNLKPFVTKIDLKIGEVVVNTFDGMLDHPCLTSDLVKVATDIMNMMMASFGGETEKKQQSPS